MFKKMIPLLTMALLGCTGGQGSRSLNAGNASCPGSNHPVIRYFAEDLPAIQGASALEVLKTWMTAVEQSISKSCPNEVSMETDKDGTYDLLLDVKKIVVEPRGTGFKITLPESIHSAGILKEAVEGALLEVFRQVQGLQECPNRTPNGSQYRAMRYFLSDFPEVTGLNTSAVALLWMEAVESKILIPSKLTTCPIEMSRSTSEGEPSDLFVDVDHSKGALVTNDGSLFSIRFSKEIGSLEEFGLEAHTAIAELIKQMQ